jgi:uncharacterized protein
VKVFFDTNVLVSAFTSGGICLDLVKQTTEDTEHSLLVGTVIIEELSRVLTNRFQYPAHKLERVTDLLRRNRVVTTPKTKPPIPVRDPDDEFVLASALEAQADVLVTGDKDLLTLGDTAGIKIVDPRTLWEMLTKK